MSVKQFTKTITIFQCVCEHSDCGCKWESDHMPKRCSRCKRHTWNGVDRRATNSGRPRIHKRAMTADELRAYNRKMQADYRARKKESAQPKSKQKRSPKIAISLPKPTRVRSHE